MAAPVPPTSPLHRAQRRSAVLFITPFLVLFAAVMIAPLGYAAWMSLHTERASGLGFGGAERVFSGLSNYSEALGDPAFRDSFTHIAAYCAIYIPVMIGSALLLALLVDSAAARAKKFFQIAYFLPHAVPGLIATLIWIYLYTPGLSPVIDLIEALGGSWNFFAADKALFSVVNIAAWQWIGYNTIIYYAALQAVPRETLEAADMDGAGAVRTALQIKLPYIRSAVVLTVLFTAVGSVQLFTEPMIVALRAASLGREWSPTMYIFNAAFSEHDYGLAAAASLLLAAVAGSLSYIVTKLGNRWKAV